MANINLTTGIITGTQIPLDGKAYFIALNDMKDLGIGNYKAYTYYDTMIVTCKENKNLYVWREALDNEQGVLVEGFTYPAGAIANGVDYSLKTYNFFTYFDPSGEQNGNENKIISGSVYWVEGFLYRSTVINYMINGVEYFAPITDLTLDAPDLTESRIDLFAVNDSGLVEIVKGVNAIYPVEPTLDLTTQLKVSLASIPADSDTPLNVSIEQVYDENTEWTSSLLPPTTVATINLESTNGPSLNTLCIEGTDVNPARAFKFLKSFLLPTIGVSSLAFDFKSKAAEVYGIYIVLSKEGNVVSQLIVENNTYGFTSTKIDNYQTANIPLSAFNLTVDDFDEIQFSFVYVEGTISSVTGFFMDNIRFVSGVNNPVSDNSYLALEDTQDTSYSGKEGYSPVVINENSLRLERSVKFTDLYKGNAVIYGGVEHQPSISDLSYRVWSTSYIINGIVYFTPVSEIVTLNAAPTTAGEKRLDVFAIAIINGAPRAIAIEGVADVSPVLPNLDQSTQVQVGFKLLDTNETVPPEIETLLVYNENIGDPQEWRPITFPTSADLNYLIDPFNGLKSIRIPTPSMPRLSWTSDATKVFNEDGSVVFALKLNALLSGFANIKVGFSNLAETTASILWINTRNLERYGIENALKGWQRVQIPLSAFNYPGTEIDKFYFEFENTPDIQIDLVQLQTGIELPPLGIEGVTKTSQLANDGENGIDPYITAQDIVPSVSEQIDVSAEWTGSGLVFDVSANKFPVNNLWYSATAAQITLDASDSSFDRIDIIVANINGTVGFVTGTASINPAEPNYDFTTQYAIKFVLVKANATTPDGYSDIVIFNEDAGEPTEWTFIPSIEVVASTNDFHSGLTSVEATNTNYSGASFNSATPIEAFRINTVSFWLKLKEEHDAVSAVSCAFGDSTSGGWSFNIYNGQWGYDASNLNWQKITIDLFQRGITIANVDSLSINPYKAGGSAGWFIDEIQIQTNTQVVDPSLEKTKTSDFINDGENGLDPFITKLDLNNNVTEYVIGSDFSGTPVDQLVSVINDSNDFIVGENDIVIFNLQLNASTLRHKFIFKLGKGTWGAGETLVTASDFISLDNNLGAVAFSNDYNDLDNKPAGKSVQNRYADMAAMFADQANQNDALLQYVLDASGDATVGLGYAYYEYLGTTVGDITDYVKLSEEESMDVVEKTNTSEFTNDGADGTSTYAETDEVVLLKTPTDIRVIPNSVLPSTTQDVVVESKDMTSDSTVSFGTGVTINSQSVELNSFGSFIVRANVTLDATEQAIDVTVDNGLSGTATDILNVVNGTVSFPISSDWTELSVSAPDVSQTGEVISTALNTNNTAVWDGVVDETLDFVIKFNIRISALGLQENSNRHNFFAIKQSGGTNIATLQYQVEGFGLLNTYTEALGGSLGQHKESVVGITSYQEAWEWLIDNVVPEFRWNATTQELTYWRRNALVRTFPSGIGAGTKLWFDAKYLDLVNIQYIDLSTAQAGDPYNDNYLKPGDKTSLLENDGADGLNPYLDATNSPYNTVIKGVASIYTTKYQLKNLFITDTTAWTDADADRYIKNYYVDIPNDTITFYITRQYYLTGFAFNNTSQGNTITHYLDWGGFVTVPGNQAFRGNTNIQEVVFPKATGDSTFVFENNSALTKLHLPYLDLAWVQNAPLLTDVDFSKAKSLFNIKNIGAVGEIYAPEATDVGFAQANGVTSWYLPRATYLTGNMYNNSPLTNLYAPNCIIYRVQLRNANAITTLLLPNVTDASGLPARAFEADSLTTIYMPKAKSFGREAVVEGMFDGSTIGVGCTLTVNEFLRTSNGGAMNVNVAQAISRGIKVVFAKDDAPALDNRIINTGVITTYNFDLSRASDWKLTMTGDTTFTESNLPTLDRTLEYTFKLTGAFVPTFPTYWTVVGDTYNGSVSNFFSVQVHDGNSGSEEVTVFISNLA